MLDNVGPKILDIARFQWFMRLQLGYYSDTIGDRVSAQYRVKKSKLPAGFIFLQSNRYNRSLWW